MSIFESKEVKQMARKAVAQSKQELDNTPRHLLDKSNPNHPDYDLKLFGYNVDEFLSKQFKR